MNVRMGLLMLALGVTVWLSLTAPDEAPGEVAQAVVRPASRGGVVGKPALTAGGDALLPALSPRPAPYKSLDAALAAELAEKEPPIFHAQTWNPPPPKVVAKVEPPKAPPWPYAYLGKQSAQGEWWVYLTLGEDTRVVKKDQVLDGKYRIDRIEPPWMSVTFLPLNEVQTVNIGAFK
ncbi:MAG: hypothetical protein CFE39_01950 [Comamonadaceae bacterium PBBC2]|nr:MAG: hypothetical protein CFE39_01950 [Comamonadaceae bacterium PBBC2]